MAEHYDLIVIGSGPGGLAAACAAAADGARVAVVERQLQPGGTSLLYGTIPTKTLREAVLYLRGVRQRAFYGEDFTERETITPSELLTRVDKVVADRVQVVRRQLEDAGVTLHVGYHATVASPTQVEAWQLDDPLETLGLSADRIILATGSRPRQVPGLTVDNEVIFDSDSVTSLLFRRAELPRSMIVLGAGVIGTEVASMFGALGSAVHLVHRGAELFSTVDRDLVAVLEERLATDGVTFHPHCDVEEARRLDEGGARVSMRDGRRLDADCVVVALGREVASEVLGLDDVGVELKRYGLVAVNELFQTNVPSIYAVGDVIGSPSLASTAFEEGRKAAAYALGRAPRNPGLPVPMCIYTIPAIASVGFSEFQLREMGVPHAVGRARYEQLTKAGIVGDEQGMLKLLFEPNTRQLLGAHIVGDLASELIHVAQAVLAHNGSIEYFVDGVVNFPTLAEAYKQAALDGLSRGS
ncbi:MAG: Si-specific NAD(P)(+) transhydrogenase [Deltaproteobacteria bacterium]|nr:Si-specific NAD(P)(+) transhydrogenase [Deltaproteobacteria bacterium]